MPSWPFNNFRTPACFSFLDRFEPHSLTWAASSRIEEEFLWNKILVLGLYEYKIFKSLFWTLKGFLVILNFHQNYTETKVTYNKNSGGKQSFLEINVCLKLNLVGQQS